MILTTLLHQATIYVKNSPNPDPACLAALERLCFLRKIQKTTIKFINHFESNEGNLPATVNLSINPEKVGNIDMDSDIKSAVFVEGKLVNNILIAVATELKFNSKGQFFFHDYIIDSNRTSSYKGLVKINGNQSFMGEFYNFKHRDYVLDKTIDFASLNVSGIFKLDDDTKSYYIKSLEYYNPYL